ncbi:methylated-DNA-protein-cysteine methyltransferase related protein [Metschnikowia aff. pulcherrima]|uniref:6-O-methylguanine-DNA methyltransferase n=1 Tax=Metschnikowia aff. pulcherrima TaxID=2163413 RepID=A0A4P6XS45_9ASCO|nr:methylated-DNA-protein-cysteine methyltransferase related protein [Metschnikowia aff. pulcherrima]
MLSDEAKAFHYAVYAAVSQIPYGRVTNYGHIAYLIGRPQNSRRVGLALKNYLAVNAFLRHENAAFDNLPWWRVISSTGLIAKRDGGEHEQKRRLVAENVVVNGMTVSWADYGWFPDEIDDE